MKVVFTSGLFWEISLGISSSIALYITGSSAIINSTLGHSKLHKSLIVSHEELREYSRNGPNPLEIKTS